MPVFTFYVYIIRYHIKNIAVSICIKFEINSPFYIKTRHRIKKDHVTVTILLSGYAARESGPSAPAEQRTIFLHIRCFLR